MRMTQNLSRGWLTVVITAVALAASAEFPPICNPTPVKKTVTPVRREIVVSIIGEDILSKPKDCKWDLQRMIDHWTSAMDREIVKKPDLVILPEVIDYYTQASAQEKLAWYRFRGDGLMKAMQAYAKRHRIYLVFNSARQRPDGRIANTTWTLDRDGDLIAAYDKKYPTPRGMEAMGEVPGDGPVVVDTDFGRLGFITCFDLNFTDFAEEYRPLRPDILCFCSYYDGNYMRRYWASRVEAHVIASTVGSGLPKSVVGPSGEEFLFEPAKARRTVTLRVNTNFRVIHYDHNHEKLAAARAKYGHRLFVTDPTRAGTFTLFSRDPKLPVDDVVKEFEMETWREYHDRTLRLKAAVPPEKGPEPRLFPKIVKKPVKVVRRPIRVAIIGEGRMNKPKGLKWDIQEVVDYWTSAMDGEMPNRPDLLVLPEGIDHWNNISPGEKAAWMAFRGDKLMKAMQAYAKRHRVYLVYNSATQFKDGRFANTSWTIDRDGDVIGAYDKAFPTPREMEWPDYRTVPGTDPVVVDTDFGRLGFVTCFDLNFTPFADRYRPLGVDVMIFCSYYDGNYMREYWASRCQSYLVSSTVGGGLPKTIVGPSGEPVRYLEQGRVRTVTDEINTNFRVIHWDDNYQKLNAALKKYGDRLYITDPTRAGTFTLFSSDPALPVDDVVKEFGIETWTEYYDRTLRLRRKMHEVGAL